MRFGEFQGTVRQWGKLNSIPGGGRKIVLMARNQCRYFADLNTGSVCRRERYCENPIDSGKRDDISATDHSPDRDKTGDCLRRARLRHTYYFSKSDYYCRGVK